MIEMTAGFLFSIVALFGWLGCLGHLILARVFRAREYSLAWIFPMSVAAIIFFLVTITPFIPLPFPWLTILGWALVAVWVTKHPVFPPVNIPSWKNIPFISTMILLLAYARVYLFTPDAGFDSFAYHIPFIRAFAEHGTIALPLNPSNWTEHVYYVFPKGVEMVFGLGEHLVPSTHGLIQFLILVHAVLLLNQIAHHAGVKNGWWAGAFFLAAWPTLFYTKLYYVELTIFMLVGWLIVAFLSHAPKHNDSWVGFHSFVVGLIAFAIASCKINALSYVGALALLLYFHQKQKHLSGAVILGGVLGVGASILPTLLSGVSFLDELKIVQATATGFHTTFIERAFVMTTSIKNFWLTPTLLGISLGVSALMFYFHPPSRKFTGLFWGCLLAFLGVFLVSDLFLLTYLQIGTYYGYAFVGLAFISIPLFYDFVVEKFVRLAPLMKGLLYVALLVGGFSIFSNATFFTQGGVNQLYYYSDLFPHVPDEENVHVLMINNINTPYGTYSHARVSDYTAYPRMDGNPCDFWREQKITHVVYWHPFASTFQLDGGNPSFYRESLEELRKNTCTRLLNTPDPTHEGPIVARVNQI